jgi:hypothetical protein
MRFSRLLTCLVAGALMGIPSARASDLGDTLGCVHIQGQYFFGTEDYLNQGADQVLGTGSRVLKVEMSHLTDNNNSDSSKYRWNSNWPTCTSLTSLAQTTYFQTVFDKPFDTFVITAVQFYAPSGQDPAEFWLSGWTSTDRTNVYNEYKAFATYLLNNPAYAGKTFVLENWEGDWALWHRSSGNLIKPTAAQVTNMTNWFNAKMDAIHDAVNAAPNSQVHVYGAIEVNRIANAMGFGTHTEAAGWKDCTNDVLPNTRVDLASYSSYDSQEVTSGTYSFANAVAYLAGKLPATAAFGQNTQSVAVGEFGLDENVAANTPAHISTTMNNVIDTVVNDNLAYACYWNVYANTMATGFSAPATANNQVLGYWMVKPDATVSTGWNQYRLNIITSSTTRATTAQIIANSTKKYNSAFPSSGTSLGTGWTINTSSSFNWKCLAGNLVQLSYTTADPGFPSGLATLNVAAVAGRAMQVGDYAQCTVRRVGTQGANAGAIGVKLFGAATASGLPTGNQPFFAWAPTLTNWNVISFASDGSNPNYTWGVLDTLGFRIDSADGTFATVSFYLNGNYIGSNLYQTNSTTVSSFSLFGQNNAVSQMQFGNVQVYFGK